MTGQYKFNIVAVAKFLNVVFVLYVSKRQNVCTVCQNVCMLKCLYVYYIKPICTVKALSLATF
jgi:hypothetical protein